MQILTIKLALKKAYAWLKKNWKFVAGLSVSLILMLLTRKTFDFSKILKHTNESYREEIDAINEAHSVEIESRNKEIKRYTEIISQIEREYAKKEEALTAAGEKEIKRLIRENEDDPDEITRRLAELTGFTIHVD